MKICIQRSKCGLNFNGEPKRPTNRKQYSAFRWVSKLYNSLIELHSIRFTILFSASARDTSRSAIFAPESLSACRSVWNNVDIYSNAMSSTRYSSIVLCYMYLYLFSMLMSPIRNWIVRMGKPNECKTDWATTKSNCWRIDAQFQFVCVSVIVSRVQNITQYNGAYSIRCMLAMRRQRLPLILLLGSCDMTENQVLMLYRYVYR